MADQVQLRGGSTSQNDAFTGAPRELSVDTTKSTVRVHDGATQGGFELARVNGDSDITLGTDKVTLDATTGSATFAGAVQSGGNGASGTADGCVLNPSGLVQSSRTGSFTLWAGYQTGTASGTSSILANGSATFGPTGGGKVSMEGMGTTQGTLIISNPTGSNSFNCFRVVSQGTNKVVFTQGGSATFSGTVTATVVPPSDAKFKENITPAKPQLADVVALGKLLKNYDWNADAPVNDELRAQRQLGLIAQEAEVVCPSLVKTIGEGEDSFKGLSTDVIIMKLLGAVAELQDQINTLKAV